MKHTLSPAVVFSIFASFCFGQPAENAEKNSVQSTYILGPDDQINVVASDVEELSGKAPVRIDMQGTIKLPMVGRIQAGGLTAEQLEAEVGKRLKKYMQNPEVVISIVEFRSQPVSILGAVTTPGVLQLQGRKTLFEVISLAGGLKPEAGYSVKVTRRLEWGKIPLPSATDDPTGEFSVATLSVKNIMEGKSPQENILVKPNDVISVPKAELIYVIGAVRKSGGFVLGEHETLSTLQVVSLAEGLDRTAAPQNAKILRIPAGSSVREEIPVDLKKILTGKSNDLPLKAEDILFVPNSAAKNITMRSLEAAIQIGTGFAIYRR